MFWLKLALMPALIGAVSLAGRRFGPGVIGWIVGLPVVGGPIVLFLALEQGAAFAARSAAGTLAGIVALSTYCLMYAWVSQRAGWVVSLACGWGSYFAVAALLPWLPSNLALLGAAAFASLTIAVRSFPLITIRDTPIVAPPGEIFLRMAAATALLVALTAAARTLGPRWSGILTPFPIFASVLPVFTHRGAGGQAAAKQLKGILTGLFSFAFFFVVIAALVEPMGIPAAFSLAAASAVALHGASLAWMRRQVSG